MPKTWIAFDTLCSKSLDIGSGSRHGTDAGTMSVEIIQTVSRRHWTPAQKMRMIDDSMKPGNSVSRTARQNGISPALLYKWRKLMLEGGTVAVEADEQVVSISEVKALKKLIKELERSLGRKTLENDLLKAAVELGRKKKLISPAPLSGIEGFE